MVTIYNGNLGLVKDLREVAAARRHPRGAVHGRGGADRSHHRASQAPSPIPPVSASSSRTTSTTWSRARSSSRSTSAARCGSTAATARITRPRCCRPTARSSTSTARSTSATTAASCCRPCPTTSCPSPRSCGSCATRLDRPQRVEASYLTGGITWRADYVMVINAADTRTDLTGWVTVDNKSGATYGNAALKLVAGRRQPRPRRAPRGPDDGHRGEGRVPGGGEPRVRRRRASSSTTSTRSTAAPPSRTTRPSSSR